MWKVPPRVFHLIGSLVLNALGLFGATQRFNAMVLVVPVSIKTFIGTFCPVELTTSPTTSVVRCVDLDLLDGLSDRKFIANEEGVDDKQS